MKYRKIKLFSAVILAGLITTAYAESNTLPNYVTAQIISVKPNYETKEVAYRKCHLEPRPFVYQSQRAVEGSGSVIGGIAGGVIGNRIGHGNGNIAATIGGTIVGALVGNQMERDINRPEMHYHYIEICKMHYKEKEVVNGYIVTYLYNGQTQTKFMKKKPQGDEIHLALTPIV